MFSFYPPFHSLSLSCFLFLSLSLSFSLSLSLFISAPSFSLWLQDTCHLMPFTKYSLLDQSYFFTPYLSIVSYKIHQLFTDYLLRLPSSELLEKHLFRSRANRRLVFSLSRSHLHILTSSLSPFFSLSRSHLHILTSSLSPFSLLFLSLAFFIFLSLGRGWYRR